MLVRATRWFLITAPVVAGILVIVLGTAGSISTTFGIVLIGIGPIVWMWNWLVRMSFEEEPASERRTPRARPEQPAEERPHRQPAPGHDAAKLTRRPRRRS